jgi:bacterioferritin (cytochrome b1)
VSDKADPMDVPAVLEHLDAALRLQYRSVLQFALAAGGGTGALSFAVGEQLHAYGEAEYADLRLLVSKIVALGGQPTTDLPPLSHEPETEDALSLLIGAEEEAIEALHAVIPHSGQEPRSEALEHLLEHLIMRKQNQVDFLVRARG